MKTVVERSKDNVAKLYNVDRIYRCMNFLLRMRSANQLFGICAKTRLFELMFVGFQLVFDFLYII